MVGAKNIVESQSIQYGLPQPFPLKVEVWTSEGFFSKWVDSNKRSLDFPLTYSAQEVVDSDQYLPLICSVEGLSFFFDQKSLYVY